MCGSRAAKDRHRRFGEMQCKTRTLNLSSRSCDSLEGLNPGSRSLLDASASSFLFASSPPSPAPPLLPVSSCLLLAASMAPRGRTGGLGPCCWVEPWPKAEKPGATGPVKSSIDRTVSLFYFYFFYKIFLAFNYSYYKTGALSCTERQRSSRSTLHVCTTNPSTRSNRQSLPSHICLTFQTV